MEENIQTPPPTTITPSLVTPVIPTSPSKTTGFSIFFVVLILVLLTSTGVFAYQNWQLRRQLNAPTTYAECIKAPGSVLQESYPATCVTAGDKRFTQPLTDDEKKLLPPDPTANWKTYTTNRGLTFDYPEDWTVTSKTLNPGQSLKEQNRYDVIARDGLVEIVDLTKNAWTLRIVIRNAQNELGGNGPVKSIGPLEYKEIPILNRVALRSKVEDGVLPFYANYPEPYPLPILFQRRAGETDASFPIPDSQNSYVLLFSTNDPSNRINVGITLYSNELTKVYIQAYSIDANLFSDIIDQILSTFKFVE